MNVDSPRFSPGMDRFAVVLWEPQDPINLGSVVRVCRNTDVRDLRLIRPRSWNPEVILITAPRSERFLEQHVRRFDEMEPAVEGLHKLYALTARGRRERQRRFRVDELAEHLAELSNADARVGFLFGREDAGLPNEAIDRCDGYITLESSADYSSMNLAQAVLLIVWSLFKRFGDAAPLRAPQKEWPPADHAQVSRMMDDVERALDTIAFFRGDQRENILRTIRQTLLRAEMDSQELATFWGVFKQVQKHDERQARLAARAADQSSSGK